MFLLKRILVWLAVFAMGSSFAPRTAAATLSATYADVPVDAVVDLSAEGPVDWIHWGTFTEYAHDRKAGVAPQINDFTIIGTGFGPYQYADNYCGYSWSDGVPNAKVDNTTTGVYKLDKFDGFQFTVRADTTLRILKVYVGAFAAEGTFQAILSDGSASSYSSSAVDNSGNGPAGVYTIHYAAASSNRLLTVRFTVNRAYNHNEGNVTLQAAALSYATNNNPPTVTFNTPSNNQGFLAPTDLVIDATPFDTDGVITNVEFFEGTNWLAEVTNAPYTFIWSNVPPGNFVLTARATDDLGASYVGVPVKIFGCSTGGVMTGVFGIAATNISLSAEGTHDWTHWGLVTSNSFDRRRLVVPQISNFAKIGTDVVQRLSNDRTRWSWTNGTPTLTATNSATGIFINGYANGYELTLPADTTLRTAKIYLGVYAARGNFEATLSDFSAPAFTHNSIVNLYNNSFRFYTLDYAAASDGQTLTIKFTDDALFDSKFGNVTLQSATLTGDKPVVSLLTPTNNAKFIIPTNITFNAQAYDRDGTILAVEFFEGTNKLGEATNTPYSFVWSNVVEGVYNVAARAIDDDSDSSFSPVATVLVVTNVWPTVAIAAPTNNAMFIEQDNVTLTAQASDTDGSVRLVEFFVGENKIGQRTNTPYTLIWSNVVVGEFTLSARAIDDRGDSNASPNINVIVVSNTPPFVAITNPITGAGFYGPTNIQIKAQASDSDGSVKLVEFFQGEIKLGQRTNAPFSLTWSNVTRGNYTLSAKATDNKNAVSFSAPVEIIVSNRPPIVAFTYPTNGANIFEGTNLVIHINATDLDGAIELVETFEGTNKIGELTNAPFSLIWSNVPLGNYALSARATDDFGDTTDASPVSFNAVSNQPPVVSILAPTNSAIFFRPANISISVAASDSDGIIQSVQIFDGTNLLTQRTNVPYNFIWTNAPLGTHTLTAQAADNWYGTNLSEPITISVSNTPPSIAFTYPLNGANIFEGTNLTIHVNATDVDGSIALVEFYESTNKIGEMTNGPFTLVWSNVPFGEFVLSAKATDDFGDSIVSSNVNISAISNQIPTITLLTPTNGQTFFQPAEILLSTEASDNDGFIRVVEFFEGTNLVAALTNPPFSLIWSNVAVGTYSLTAQAADNWTGANLTAPILITVSNTPPQIELLNPTNNEIFFEGTNVTLAAETFDPGGEIVLVEFYESTNKIGEVTNEPFTLIWSNVPFGNFVLSAKATDDFGDSTVSSNVSISAISNQIPTISFLTPTNGQNFFQPTEILLSAGANDSDGFVRLIEFFEGTNLLATLTNPPFSFVWSNVAVGIYELTAQVADNWRGSNLTEAIIITVSNTPPQIALLNPTNNEIFFESTNVTLEADAFDPGGEIVLVEFFEGTNKIGEVTNAPFTLVWSNVALGDFVLSAKATDDFGDATASSNVTIHVVSNQLPSISFLGPTNGQIFFRPADILLSAEANDSDGTIRLVEIYEGTNLLAALTNSPYSFIWSNVTVGTYSLTAQAADNWRGTNLTDAIVISVSNTPPTVAITDPTNGANIFEGTNLVINVNAADVDGAVSRVEFYESTNKMGEVTNAPFTLIWSNVPFGEFVLSARATDDFGDTTTSAPVSISSISNQLPIISVLSPTNSQNFFRPVNILLSAEASDNDGFIRLVEFFEGTNLLTRLSNAPYSFIWSNVAIGSYSFTAQVADNWRGTNLTEQVVITVSNTPPQITLISPTNTESFFEGTNITLVADAFDPDGEIALVEFFESTNKIGEVTNAPFILVWSNVPFGEFTLSVKATDDFGDITISSNVNISAISNQLPFITFLTPSNGQNFFRPADILLSAQASDGDGIIRLVEFFEGTNLLAQLSNAPYSFVWSNVAVGTYSLTALTADNWIGTNITESLLISVSNTPPTVAIADPTNGANIFGGTNLVINVSAADVDGTVTRVEFYESTNKMGEVTNAPFTLIWSNVPFGEFVLSAKATDDFGGATTSSNVTIHVVSNQVPEISFLSPTTGQNFFRPTDILLSAEASDNDGTIRLVEFFEGTNLLVQLSNAPYSFVWSNVALGVYSLTARAADNWTGTNVATLMITVSNTPPEIALLNPTNNEVFFEGANITLVAEAFDLDGELVLVEFYESTNKISEVTNEPFTLIWSNVALGDFVFSAKATDDFGDSTTSSNATIHVVSNQVPVISFLAPTNGQNFFRPADILLNAEASDNDGTIRLVEFFEGSNLLAQCSNAPYSFIWSNAAVGTYSLAARATDNWYGTNLATLTITVSNTPPQIALLNPTNNEVFFEGTNITLVADASDLDGDVLLVEFYESTNKIGEVTNEPFTLVWSNVPFGNFVLSAKATDDFGDSTVSSNVTINAISNQIPTIAFLTPTNGQNFFRPANILLSADATDNDGTIRLVEFFEGTNLLATLTNTPYSFIWSNVAVGTYSLTAQAADNWTRTNLTPPILISIIKPPPLAVTLLNATLVENKFSFKFITETDFIYTIEFSDSLSPIQWQPLTNFAGNGAQLIFSEDYTNAHRFYRVLAE